MVIPENILRELIALIKQGDETRVREFLISNIKELPQKTQDAIITAFLEEALLKENGDSLISDFRGQGIGLAKAIEREADELERQIKLAEIKKQI